MVNPFASRSTENKWVVPVSCVSLLMGLMVSWAWITDKDKNQRIQLLDSDQKLIYSQGTLDLSKDNERLRNSIERLREENTKLQNAVALNNNASQSLNKSLQEIKLFAALTEIVGSGIAITLRDADLSGPATMMQIVHDTDVLRVVNELWNSGAEAVSVNNRRVGPTTNFRCVGTTILVDGVKIATPVTIRAVGDSDTLFGGMNLPGGVLDDLRQTDSKMVEVVPVEKMRLPAFSGSSSFKVGRPPEGSG